MELLQRLLDLRDELNTIISIKRDELKHYYTPEELGKTCPFSQPFLDYVESFRGEEVNTPQMFDQYLMIDTYFYFGNLRSFGAAFKRYFTELYGDLNGERRGKKNIKHYTIPSETMKQLHATQIN